MKKESQMPEISFCPWKFGPFKPKNRIFLGAMSRCRCTPTGEATTLTKKFFHQRSQHAGFTFTGSMYVEPRGHTYPNEPAMTTKAHSESWKPVVEAVHQNNSYIFAQLFHGGRAMHHKPVDFDYGVSPSGINTDYSEAYFDGEVVPQHLPPRAMTCKEISCLVKSFEKSAKFCLDAGFDGVELNAANGYLIDNFIRSSSNRRTDQYGGSTENRCRLALEIIDKLIDVFGANKVGIKLSPATRFNNMYDEDPITTYNYLLAKLSERKILYVQFTEPEPAEKIGYEYWGGLQLANSAEVFRSKFNGFFITNGYMSISEAGSRIQNKLADAVAFSTRFIANPDLPKRIQNGYTLAQPNRKFFYSGGESGYTDYPEYQ